MKQKNKKVMLNVFAKADQQMPANKRTTISVDISISEQKWNRMTKSSQKKIIGKRLGSLLRYETRITEVEDEHTG